MAIAIRGSAITSPTAGEGAMRGVVSSQSLLRPATVGVVASCEMDCGLVATTFARGLLTTSARLTIAERTRVGPQTGRASGKGVGLAPLYAQAVSIFVVEVENGLRRRANEEGLQAASRLGSRVLGPPTFVTRLVTRRRRTKMAESRHGVSLVRLVLAIHYGLGHALVNLEVILAMVQGMRLLSNARRPNSRVSPKTTPAKVQTASIEAIESRRVLSQVEESRPLRMVSTIVVTPPTLPPKPIPFASTVVLAAPSSTDALPPLV